MLTGFQKAIAALIEYRQREGEELSAILNEQVGRIGRLLGEIENDPSRTPEAIAARLEDQLARLGDLAMKMDQDRLYQEVALLATRSDTREELDRLQAHVAGAGELIARGSPVGRKLEFLAQEFNRETNTLCSKSGSVRVTELGLELTVVIDQFREQILNVE